MGAKFTYLGAVVRRPISRFQRRTSSRRSTAGGVGSGNWGLLRAGVDHLSTPMKTLSAMTAFLLTAAAGFEARPAAAHHSWSAEYDLSRSTYISGTVTRVQLRNPHSAVVLSVTAENGRQERWIVEWGSPQRLRDRGVTAQTLRVGDELLVTGNPHRDADVRSLRAVSVRRSSDGTELAATVRPAVDALPAPSRRADCLSCPPGAAHPRNPKPTRWRSTGNESIDRGSAPMPMKSADGKFSKPSLPGDYLPVSRPHRGQATARAPFAPCVASKSMAISSKRNSKTAMLPAERTISISSASRRGSR